MAEKPNRNFWIFWSQRVLNATWKMKVFVFTEVLSTLWDQKMQKFLLVFSAMWWVWGVSECYISVSGAIRRCLTASDRIWDSKIFWTKKAEVGPAGPKICTFFSSEISAGCAFGCKYFSVGWVIQKGPKGSKVCQNKFEPHTTLQSWDFAFWVKKNVHFPPLRKQMGVIL